MDAIGLDDLDLGIIDLGEGDGWSAGDDAVGGQQTQPTVSDAEIAGLEAGVEEEVEEFHAMFGLIPSLNGFFEKYNF